MNTLTRSLLLALALAVLVGLAGYAQAAPADNWGAVKARIEGATDYSLKYDYSSERGSLKFDYSVVLAGPKIRTEVLRGSSRNVVNVVLYDPSFSKE